MARKPRRATRSRNNKHGRSTQEQRFWEAWQEHGLPDAPLVEKWKTDELRSALNNHQFEWDFAWPKCRILIEVQGVGPGHCSASGVARDARKARVALANGYVVIPVSSNCMSSKAKREALCEEIKEIVLAMGTWE